MSHTKSIIFTITAFLLYFQSVQSEEQTPIVIWHGMGDSCCFPFSMGAIKKQLQEELPGVYVMSIKIGDSLIADVESSYFMHPDKQIEIACDMIANDSNLANGYNAIGFSQGSQFLRGVAQRCPSPRMKNYISVGGQHQGIYGLPKCENINSRMCDYLRKLLNHAAYLSWVQKFLTQATFWHDPLNEELYRNGSTFLSDLNNELNVNETYVENLKILENIVLIRFENDDMVIPIDSEWFGFYTPGQAKETEKLQDSKIYDRLGLRQIETDGKLHFLSTPGNHLQFEWSWFVENVIKPFLKQ